MHYFRFHEDCRHRGRNLMVPAVGAVEMQMGLGYNSFTGAEERAGV